MQLLDIQYLIHIFLFLIYISAYLLNYSFRQLRCQIGAATLWENVNIVMKRSVSEVVRLIS